jgi:twinkle protein
MNNKQPASVFLKHTSCDACGSSDGNSLYSDGHTYCHVCHTYAHGDDDTADTRTKGKIVYMTQQQVEQQGQFKAMPDRGITLATCEKFGVTQDAQKHYYPYADSEGTRVAYKVRTG